MYFDRLLVLTDQSDKQSTVMRINESLISRGYLTNMKGSSMDARSLDLIRHVPPLQVVPIMPSLLPIGSFKCKDSKCIGIT